MKTYLGISDTTLAPILAVPNSEHMIIRSTSSADTGSMYMFGTTPGPPVADATATAVLTGDVEKELALTWSSLTRIAMTAPTGAVTIRRPGLKAGGQLLFASNPADGETVIVGVTGHTKTYTFKDGEKSSIQTVADVANSLNGKYFDIYDGANAVRVWFKTSGGASTPPATPSGGRLIQVTINTGDSANTVASTVYTVLDGDALFSASVLTNTVTVILRRLGNTTAIAAGTSGFTVGTVTGGTDSANQIAIGKTLYATCANMADAMNDNATNEGSLYGTGTTAHALLAAYADAGHTDLYPNGTSEDRLYLQDRIACQRMLPWTVTGTAIGGSITLTTVPIGGENGVLLCEISPSQAGAGASLTLDSNASVNVPNGYLATFDPVQVHGRNVRLFLQNKAAIGDADFTIRGGPDVDHLVDQTVLTSSGTTVVQSDLVQGCEFIQVEITAMTGDIGAYAALVF